MFIKPGPDLEILAGHQVNIVSLLNISTCTCSLIQTFSKTNYPIKNQIQITISYFIPLQLQSLIFSMYHQWLEADFLAWYVAND